MDLRTTLASTLSPNTTERQQAETTLKAAEDQPGFVGALLDVLRVEEDQGVRLSTAM